MDQMEAPIVQCMKVLLMIMVGFFTFMVCRYVYMYLYIAPIDFSIWVAVLLQFLMLTLEMANLFGDCHTTNRVCLFTRFFFFQGRKSILSKKLRSQVNEGEREATTNSRTLFKIVSLLRVHQSCFSRPLPKFLPLRDQK